MLYDAEERLRVKANGNAAMCLAINKAKEDLAESLAMGGACVLAIKILHSECHKISCAAWQYNI